MSPHGLIIVIGQSKPIKFHTNPFGTLPRYIFICSILIFTLFEAWISSKLLFTCHYTIVNEVPLI
jgi:hypothetical protein